MNDTPRVTVTADTEFGKYVFSVDGSLGPLGFELEKQRRIERHVATLRNMRDNPQPPVSDDE